MNQALPTDRPHLFEVLVDWSMAHGAIRINELPGCWERSVSGIDGGTWHVAINGHRRKTKSGIPPGGADGSDVLPFTVMVWWNGWPAGIVDPTGWQIAAGAAANEVTFRAAIAKDTPPEIPHAR